MELVKRSKLSETLTIIGVTDPERVAAQLISEYDIYCATERMNFESVIKKFCSESLLVDSNSTLRNDDLWGAFDKWRTNIDVNASTITQTRISKFLKSKGFEQRSVRYEDGCKRTWFGLRLKES